MTKQNSYEILGVQKTASDDDIKVAYRKLAIKFHPDKNPGDSSAANSFLEITAAYDTVKDPAKRRTYDESLLAPKPQSAPLSKSNAATGGKVGFDIADALREFMATMQGDSALRESFEGGGRDIAQGENKRITIALSLHDVAIGVQKTAKVNVLKPCTACAGSGAIGGTATLSTCKKCDGHGMLRVAGSTETIKCPQCMGTAHEVINACTTCKGSGRKPGTNSVVITFPPGIGEGNFLTLPGQGDAGLRNGKPGDLLVYMEQIPDAQFRRMGYDLETDATISVLTAILGGQCMMLTLEGETVSLQIPSGTQPETLFWLKNKGLPQYHGKLRGSLYARVHVRIPKSLTSKEQELYQSLQHLCAHPAATPAKSSSEPSWVMRQEGSLWLINAGSGRINRHIFEKPEVVELLAKKNQSIGLDLQEVTFIESMDIGLWMRIGKAIQKNNGTMFLVGPVQAIKEVIQETSIDAIFPIVDVPR